MKRRLTFISSVAVVVFSAMASSCEHDPVHGRAVDDLGPEEEGLYPAESAFHRPGEPCALCHSKKGPADSEFVLAGTVYWGPDDERAPVDKAYVRILDAQKTKRCFVTNCNGNFFVQKKDFSSITFPLLVSVERTVNPGFDESTLAIRRMSGHIGREASCATCHLRNTRDFASPGPIRLFNSRDEVKERGAPVVPCPPPSDYVPLERCPEDRE